MTTYILLVSIMTQGAMHTQIYPTETIESCIETRSSALKSPGVLLAECVKVVREDPSDG